MSKIMVYRGTESFPYGIQMKFGYEMPSLAVTNQQIEEDHQRLEELGEILKLQYTRAINEVINEYSSSELPIKYIQKQKILIGNLLPYEKFGGFSRRSDEILVDADTIAGLIYSKPPGFLYGHEVGHKMYKYKGSTKTLEELSSIIGVYHRGNELLFQEILCDGCGEIVKKPATDEQNLLRYFDPNKREGIKRLALKTAYKC